MTSQKDERPTELRAGDLPKVYRELGADAICAGFTITRTRGMHLQWRGPNGGTVHTAFTPSDWRAIKNDRARLERIGLPKRGQRRLKEKKKQEVTPEYAAWRNMKQRCLNSKNPRYADYGGRGITVCERWLDFETFLADVGLRPSPELTLDRINNDGNYEPGNVRWTTRTAQQQNRRK